MKKSEILGMAINTLALTAATANETCTCGLYERHEDTCVSAAWSTVTT